MVARPPDAIDCKKFWFISEFLITEDPGHTARVLNQIGRTVALQTMNEPASLALAGERSSFTPVAAERSSLAIARCKKRAASLALGANRLRLTGDGMKSKSKSGEASIKVL
jgi:hypothetical protein